MTSLRAPALAVQVVQYVLAHPATRGGRWSALRRAIGWQLAKLGGADRVTLELLGLKLRCHRDSTAASAVLYAGLPEWDEMMFVLRYLRPGDHFVDVGANIGFYSLLAAGACGARVTAVEPGQPALDRLRENLELNGLGAVDVAPLALAESDGRMGFTSGLDVLNRLVIPGDVGLATVPVTTLDALVREAPVALVKIDVEGAEARVLRGAARVLGRSEAPVIILEMLPGFADRFGDTAGSVRGVLAGHGYALHEYAADRNALDPLAEGAMPASGYVVAARDADAVRVRLAEGVGRAPSAPIAVQVRTSTPAARA